MILVTGAPTNVWAIDPVHSNIDFTVAHLGINIVRGSFSRFSGGIEIGDDAFAVAAVIDATSIYSGNVKRDERLRSADFFDVETFPAMSVKARSLGRGAADEFTLDGELTLHGITRPVSFFCTYRGRSTDQHGKPKIGLAATTSFDRRDFGIDWNEMRDAKWTLGDIIRVSVNIEAGLP